MIRVPIRDIPSGWAVKPSPSDDGRTPNAEQPEDVLARTAEMQKILDEERVLDLRPGVYVHGHLEGSTNGGIYGSRNATTLYARDQIGDDLITLKNHSTMKGNCASYSMWDGEHSFELKDLTIDGNPDYVPNLGSTGSGNTDVSCVYLCGWNVRISNVRIYGGSANGIALERGKRGGTPPTGWENRDMLSGTTLVQGCEILHCGTGLNVIHDADSEFLSIKVARTEKEGILLNGAAMRLSCHVWGCGRASKGDVDYPGVKVASGYIFGDYVQVDNNFGTGLEVLGYGSTIGHARCIKSRVRPGWENRPHIRIGAQNVTLGRVDGYCHKDQVGIRVVNGIRWTNIDNCQLRGGHSDNNPPDPADRAACIVHSSGYMTQVRVQFHDAKTAVKFGSDEEWPWPMTGAKVDGTFKRCGSAVSGDLRRGCDLQMRVDDETVEKPTDITWYGGAQDPSNRVEVREY